MNTLRSAPHDPDRVAFPWRAFVLTCIITSLWVNASEVFRYFVFVMPMMRSALSAAVPGVAPMDLPVFLVWSAWDTVLVLMSVLFYWLYAQQFGATLKSVLVAGTLNWLFFFVLFWVGVMNMGLAQVSLLAIALPLAWLECVVACWVAQKCLLRFSAARPRGAGGSG
jgi:hypothetical protein